MDVRGKKGYWEKDRTEAAERIATLGVQGDQLRKDIAELNARAAEANLELFKLKSPRQLNDAVFKKELAGKQKWPVADFLFADASDCRFAMGIFIALSEVGWPAPIPQPLRGANQASEFLPYNRSLNHGAPRQLA